MTFSQGSLGALNKQVKPINPSRYAKPGTMRLRGRGAVVRVSPIKGITPKGALPRPVWFPALLGDYEIDEDANHTEYDTLSDGQFSQGAMGPLRARRLRSGSLDTLTMDFDPPWFVTTGQDLDDVSARLFDVLRSRKPVRLVVTLHPHPSGAGAEFAGDVTFRSINKIMRQGEVDTRYLTIAIKEWRDPSVQRRGAGAGRKRGVALPTTHVLTATDTLRSLAYEYMGSYAFWRDIRDANGIPARFGASTPIVKLPGHFRVGGKVKIPAIYGRLTGGVTRTV